MEKILEDIVKKINVRLKSMGMTQKKFSRKMGKSENWLTALKHVQKDIMLMDLIKACEILSVEPSYLLSGNFPKIIRYISMEDLIKMLVKKECENYLNENIIKISNLLTHIRKEGK